MHGDRSREPISVKQQKCKLSGAVRIAMMALTGQSISSGCPPAIGSSSCCSRLVWHWQCVRDIRPSVGITNLVNIAKWGTKFQWKLLAWQCAKMINCILSYNTTPYSILFYHTIIRSKNRRNSLGVLLIIARIFLIEKRARQTDELRPDSRSTAGLQWRACGQKTARLDEPSRFRFYRYDIIIRLHGHYIRNGRSRTKWILSIQFECPFVNYLQTRDPLGTTQGISEYHSEFLSLESILARLGNRKSLCAIRRSFRMKFASL